MKKSLKTTSKKKKQCPNTISKKKPLKKEIKAVKKPLKKQVEPDVFEEIQYYNEFDEEISTKSKIYDLFSLKIEKNKSNGKVRYHCKIKCVYPNKKQEYNKEVTTSNEVIWFFGNCSAVKKLYKKAKISTKIKI